MAMKQALGDRLTTVFLRQGHYAVDPRNIASYPPADITLERIGDLLDVDLPALQGQRNVVAAAKEQLARHVPTA